MAEPIEMLFGMWTWAGPRNHVLDGGPYPHTQRGNIRMNRGRTEHAWTCPLVDIPVLKLSRGQNQYGLDADWGVLHEDAHWRHLMNTIELSMCGGDTALCQITLITCLLQN